VLISNLKSNGIANKKVSIIDPPFTIQTELLTIRCQINTEDTLVNTRFFETMLKRGVKIKTIVIDRRMKIFTGSRK
jgi:hypothetical protein